MDMFYPLQWVEKKGNKQPKAAETTAEHYRREDNTLEMPNSVINA